MFSPSEESLPVVKHLSAPQVLPCHLPGRCSPRWRPGEGEGGCLQLQDSQFAECWGDAGLGSQIFLVPAS